MQNPDSQPNLEPLEEILAQSLGSSSKTIVDQLKRLTAHLSDEEIEEVVSTLLEQRNASPQSNSSHVLVSLVVLEAIQIVHFEVANNAGVANLIDTLVEKLSLPTTGHKGQRISYRLARRRKSGEYTLLLPQVTLYQQEIEWSCDMVLLPDINPSSS